MFINDLKACIRAGEHPGWNQVVRLSDRTMRMWMRAGKAAGVIVLKRKAKCRSLAVLPIAKKMSLHQIASYCRETYVTPRGLAMFPIGLVVVGTNQKGAWEHKLRTPDDPKVEELLSEAGFAQELTAQAYAWASDVIRGSMEVGALYGTDWSRDNRGRGVSAS